MSRCAAAGCLYDVPAHYAFCDAHFRQVPDDLKTVIRNGAAEVRASALNDATRLLMAKEQGRQSGAI